MGGCRRSANKWGSIIMCFFFSSIFFLCFYGFYLSTTGLHAIGNGVRFLRYAFTFFLALSDLSTFISGPCD